MELIIAIWATGQLPDCPAWRERRPPGVWYPGIPVIQALLWQYLGDYPAHVQPHTEATVSWSMCIVCPHQVVYSTWYRSTAAPSQQQGCVSHASVSLTVLTWPSTSVDLVSLQWHDPTSSRDNWSVLIFLRGLYEFTWNIFAATQWVNLCMSFFQGKNNLPWFVVPVAVTILLRASKLALFVAGKDVNKEKHGRWGFV